MTLKEEMSIIQLARKVNGRKNRTVDTTGSLPTVIMYISGHTSHINIRVFSQGWAEGREPDKEFEFNTGMPLEYDALKEYRDYMLKLLQRVERSGIYV